MSTGDRGEVLHSLLNLVKQIQERSSVGMCPGPALLGKTGLNQAEVFECVQELAAMELVELPSVGRSGPDKNLFLVRVTPAGKRALQSAPSSPFWRRREPEIARPGRDPNVLLHQTITLDQVLLALESGLEQSNLDPVERQRMQQLLARAQARAQRSSEAGSGPSLTQWARSNPDRLAALLESLG
ncbi:hypothetical protein JST97_16680 [bacterium]|nr:hypothetical protein [bacterium]